jgi:hypothetical protein
MNRVSKKTTRANLMSLAPKQRAINNGVSSYVIARAFALFVLFFSLSTSAKISQSIDRPNIHAGESFLLTIQVDKDTGSEPDLSLIPKEFTIISNSQYQQMSNLNGRTSIIKGWKIKLSTLVTGKIVIPPIPVGNEQTEAINLFIKDTSDQVDLNGQKKAIYLEANADQNTSYVQQQIIFTVKLYRAVNTHYARLTEPTANDSIVEKLGDDIQYDKMLSGTRYIVTERRYAIFPQKSGKLTISAINFTADVNDSSKRGGNRFLNTTRPISVNSKAVDIVVKPQPTTASTPWMPAAEVVLADKWSSSTNQLTVGEPVTWTILLYAQGLSESQIPEISLPKVDGLQFYPDTPQKERQVNDRGILGQRIEKLAVIPTKEGEITLPSVKVTWWDTKSDSEKTASIPSKTFTILAGATPQTTTEANEKIGPVTEQVLVSVDPNIFYWKAATFGFALLWLITLLVYLNKSPSSLPQERKRTKTKPFKSTIEKELNESQLYKALQLAIKQQQLEQIEKQLLLWSARLSSFPIHSLGVLSNLLQDSNVRQKIEALDAARYSNVQTDFHCDLVKKDLVDIATELTTKKEISQNEQIPELYDL